ncbi:hypothetical protein DMI60_21560 [Escherichia coli]|nr:hypothetical protein [Escherichia coli]
MVIEAAAYAAAIATANAIRIHDEEVEQKYPVMFITEYDQHEALLKSGAHLLKESWQISFIVPHVKRI